MSGIFDFLGMMGNYEERKVARYPDSDEPFLVDTCLVTDGAHPYETAVQHERYNDGQMVIVEAYDSREDALAGHARWVATMTAKELPLQLVDCTNAGVAKLWQAVGGNPESRRKDADA